jgi:Glycosyl hydrolase family 26
MKSAGISRRTLLAGLATPAGAEPRDAIRRPMLGIYAGNEPDRIDQFEEWLGGKVWQALAYTDPQSWKGIANPGWFVRRFTSAKRRCIWSVSMIPKGGTLESAAKGEHDDAFRSAGTLLAKALPHPGNVIYIRLGWELNGDWFPWAAAGREGAFIDTFRRVVRAFRGVDRRFRFEWNINYGQKMNPGRAYPGDDCVDIIGMDLYWQKQYLGSDPDRAFRMIRDDKYGLYYLDSLSSQHRKPIAFSEWGVQGNDAGVFIQLLAAWMNTRPVVYHNYWNSDADYDGTLSFDRWPAASAAFRSAFGSHHASSRLPEVK